MISDCSGLCFAYTAAQQVQGKGKPQNRPRGGISERDSGMNRYASVFPFSAVYGTLTVRSSGWEEKHMKNRRTVLKIYLAALLTLALALNGSLAGAEAFSLRGGVYFGMSPEEVVAVEESNGYNYSPTSYGEMIFKSLSDYQLYYDGNYQPFSDPAIGKVDTVIMERFEYDFDYEDQKLFQLYYLLHPIEGDMTDAFETLSLAIAYRYGSPAAEEERATKQFTEKSADGISSHNRWALPDGDDGTVIIDLFVYYDMVILAYQGF